MKHSNMLIPSSTIYIKNARYVVGSTTHKGQFSKDGENSQNLAFFFGALLSQNGMMFSIFLKRFCLLVSKIVFVFILAHVEPELELFEVDDIGDDCDDDL